jgi:hypothetical protein
MEYTETWFGMFLSDGTRLGAVDEISSLWTGKPVRNYCPKIRSCRLTGPEIVPPGALIEVNVDVADPDDDPLRTDWKLQAEQSKPGTGGDKEATPSVYFDAIVNSSLKTAMVRMPERVGPYRLFIVVRDDQGGGATANIPVLVREQRKQD